MARVQLDLLRRPKPVRVFVDREGAEWEAHDWRQVSYPYYAIRRGGRLVGSVRETDTGFEVTRNADQESQQWGWVRHISAPDMLGAVDVALAMMVPVKRQGPAGFGERSSPG